MLYGQFLYGWSNYSTADFTEELAVSLTNGTASFNASVTKVTQAIFVSGGQSDFDGDIIRVRLAISQVDGISSTQSAAGLILDGDAGISIASSLSLNGERVRLADGDIDSLSAMSSVAIRLFSLKYLGGSDSTTTAQANFISYISGSLAGDSVLTFTPNVEYSVSMDITSSCGVTGDIKLLYNNYTKDNESYTDINNGSDAYTVIPKQNESYEVING